MTDDELVLGGLGHRESVRHPTAAATGTPASLGPGRRIAGRAPRPIPPSRARPRAPARGRPLGRSASVRAPGAGAAARRPTEGSCWIAERAKADDPTALHWGGAFVHTGHGPHYWTDSRDPALRDGGRWGAKTVSRWRVDYLRDWQARMDRTLPPQRTD